ncbi:hypothetical protein ANASTE_00997 [Anaerofustis stercorihominis DSM 17244]|uniref:Uncharacterized protein n=1 Tax=Anaerofustis stercorihominis DSM 17244 TaxID=445971 RepID=B1C8E0_9FIRM|nr:hypothetical protein [Anaerofustis stercorihominis]EDS73277.1 hypothetical protein ANASTE_00997 [Anaerofustis stercorihominis DSM 17244]
MDRKDKTYKIYLMFSRSNTLLSKAIYKRTKEDYTHVAISLDDTFDTFYAFGRRNPNFMLPARFTKESPFKGLYEKNQDIKIKIVSIEINESQYESISNHLSKMYEERLDYKYDILGVMLCNGNITLNRKYHKFCSEFVSELLSSNGVIDIFKSPKHIRPYELSAMKDFDLEFEGNVYELSRLYNKDDLGYSYLSDIYEPV